MNDKDEPAFDHTSVWMAIALGLLCLLSQSLAVL